jgi:hypothetical protein
MDVSIGPVQMKLAGFLKDEGRGGMLMVMRVPGMVSEENMRQQMQSSFQQQGQQQPDILIEATETRNVNVAGKVVPFEFSRGRHQKSGVQVRQVTGLLPGEQGTVMINYAVPEDQWDEEQVLKLLQSVQPK